MVEGAEGPKGGVGEGADRPATLGERGRKPVGLVDNTRMERKGERGREGGEKGEERESERARDS